MKTILLTNDDGFYAPGLRALEAALSTALKGEYRIFTIAPDTQRSATGHCINFFNPIRVKQISDNAYTIDGSPADCVKIAADFLGEPIDMVLSGINHGPNMGTDVHYSGTVAAAREAVINEIPGIALSLNKFTDNADFSYAASYAVRIVKEIFPALQQGLYKGRPFLLNVNFPDAVSDAIRGEKITRLGQRIYHERLDVRKDPYGQQYIWVACDGITHQSIPESDLDAVAEGFVSITPLILDATDIDSLDGLSGIMDGMANTLETVVSAGSG